MLSKIGRAVRNLRSNGYDIFAHQRDQSFVARTTSFNLHLPEKGLKGPTDRISIEGRPAGQLSWSPERLRHLSEGGLRSSRMPHEAYADPITNDGPRFHSNMHVSKLDERDTRAIEASIVSSTPLVAETMDGVTHKTRPTPTEPNGARGLGTPSSTAAPDAWIYEYHLA